MDYTQDEGNTISNNIRVINLINQLVYRKEGKSESNNNEQVIAAIIYVVQWMARTRDGYKTENDSILEDKILDVYNITDDNVRNRIKDFAPQMANYYKGHIGFTVDVNDFGAANAYYESNKDEFDELYRSLGVSFERTL